MKRVAVVALLALALAGCAVPGQSLNPGTAYAFNGAEVTNSEVDAVYRAWLNDTKGAVLPNRLQVMTLDAVREPAKKIALEMTSDAAQLFTAENARFFAEQMFNVKQVDGEPSPEVIQSLQGAVAVAFIVYSDADGSQLERLADELEASIEGSPRAGDFDRDTFVQSIVSALESASNQGYPTALGYIEFYRLNGFTAPDGGVRVVAP